MKIIIRNEPPPQWERPSWKGTTIICLNCVSKLEIEKEDRVDIMRSQAGDVGVDYLAVVCPVCDVLTTKVIP